MKLRTLFLALAVSSCMSVAHADEGSVGTTSNEKANQRMDAAIGSGVSTPASGASLFRMFAGLMFCFAVFGAGIHISRRFGLGQPKGGKRRMRVLEKLPISQKSSLLLVSCDGREILLAVGPEQARILQAQLTSTREAFEESFADMYSVKAEDQRCIG